MTTSQPLMSRASRISSCEAYLPVPTKSRLENVRPAIRSGSFRSGSFRSEPEGDELGILVVIQRTVVEVEVGIDRVFQVEGKD